MFIPHCREKVTQNKPGPPGRQSDALTHSATRLFDMKQGQRRRGLKIPKKGACLNFHTRLEVEEEEEETLFVNGIVTVGAVLWAAVFTFNQYLLISLNEIIDINNSFIDINKYGHSIHLC